MVIDTFESWVHPFYVEKDDRREPQEYTYAEACLAAGALLGARYSRTWIEPIGANQTVHAGCMHPGEEIA